MKVSMKGDYGVRALIELAHHYGEGPVQSAVIASRQGVPEPYLDQLLTALRRAGFIRSVRGPQGGHALIRDPQELRLSEAIGALEGTPDSGLDLIGDTPMVRLERIRPPGSAEVIGKMESLNPAGSVKDRIALSMIEDAEQRGILRPGSTIVEPTSGNTGIGLAMVAAAKGYKLILTMPENMGGERGVPM